MKSYLQRPISITVTAILAIVLVYFLTVGFSGEKKTNADSQLIVLMYHHIDPKTSDATITPEQFKSHLQALHDNGYNVVSMDKVLSFSRIKKNLPKKSVLITFDDGYESFYKYAYPLLKEYNMVATNFIVVDSTDHPSPQAIPHLTWDEMREMKQNGMSFYSHTYDQHKLAEVDQGGTKKPMLAYHLYVKDRSSAETNEEYKNRIKTDLSLAEKRLQEELGEQPHLLAFPYGAYNQTVIDISKELGIEKTFAITEGLNNLVDYVYHRVNAGSPYISANTLMAKLKKLQETL